jgi:phage/conjugal plasmid C-4 type zinc finger TraR family protein
MKIDDYEYNNEDESDMGQLHAIHLSMNAVALHLASLPEGPSLTHCEDCGEEIPEQRRLLVQACRLCVYCKELAERR